VHLWLADARTRAIIEDPREEVIRRLQEPPQPYIWAHADAELTQDIFERAARNMSLLREGQLVGMLLGALRPRGAALLGDTLSPCPCCGVVAPWHHPYTTCNSTASLRLKLMSDFARDLERLGGERAYAYLASHRFPPAPPGPGARGPERPCHAICWQNPGNAPRGTALMLLSPEQWETVPADHPSPILSVAGAWRARADSAYSTRGVVRPKVELMTQWVALCAAYLEEITDTFWPMPPLEA
jgi:hypothetical protein